VYIPHLFHACCMPCPSYPPWFDVPINIWWHAQVMKLLIMQSSPASLRFLPLRWKSSPQYPVLKYHPCPSLSVSFLPCDFIIPSYNCEGLIRHIGHPLYLKQKTSVKTLSPYSFIHTIHLSLTHIHSASIFFAVICLCFPSFQYLQVLYSSSEVPNLQR
jgi:hypothetical protein